MIKKYLHREMSVYKHCLITYILALFLTLFLGSVLSCSEILPGDGRFIIDRVRFDGKEWSYRANPTQGQGNVYFESKTELGYIIGDTIYLSSCR